MKRFKTTWFVHAFIIIAVTVAASTAILNITLLSKTNIMELIDYALSVTGAEMSPVDSIFVARVIRQQLWLVHFLAGVLVFLLVLSTGSHYYFNKYLPKNKSSKISDEKIKTSTSIFLKVNSVFLNAIVIFILTSSGFFLYFRKELSILEAEIANLRLMHWAGVYLLLGALVYHVYKHVFVAIKSKQ